MALQVIVISVLGLGFLVLGLGFIWWGRRAGELALASQSWPTAMARITANSIQHFELEESDTPYTAKVSYTYTVDGKSYVGSRISAHGKYLSSHALAREFLDSTYPVGAEVPASYDPANPSNVVLVPGGKVSKGFFFGGAICIAGAAFMLYLLVLLSR